MRFTAYYTDDRVFTGQSVDDWKQLPSAGVLVVIEHRPTGRGVFNGGDWYWLDDSGAIRYQPSGPWGTDAEPPTLPCRSCLKQGTGVEDAVFAAVAERARTEAH